MQTNQACVILCLLVCSVWSEIVLFSDKKLSFADRYTVQSEGDQLGIHAQWSEVPAFKDENNLIEKISIVVNNSPVTNPFYDQILSTLESFPYAEKTCSISLTLTKNILDNNERISALNRTLSVIRTLTSHLPVDCVPRSPKQFAKLGKEYVYNVVHNAQKMSPVDVNGVGRVHVSHGSQQVTLQSMLKNPLQVWRYSRVYDLSGQAATQTVSITAISSVSSGMSDALPQHTSPTIYILNKNNLDYTVSTMSDDQLVSQQLQIVPSRSIELKERSISKLGLHRELRTVLEMKDESGCTNDVTVHVFEHLPTSVYVDIYELEDLRRVTMLKKPDDPVFETHVYNDKVSVETSSMYSAPIDVKFSTKMKRVGGVWRAELNVPIHFRYQEPSLEDFRTATVRPPLYVLVDGCKAKPVNAVHSLAQILNNTVHRTDSILQTSLKVNHPLSETFKVNFTNGTEKPIIISIPVGKLQEQAFVTNVTLGVTILSALALIVTACASRSKTKID